MLKYKDFEKMVELSNVDLASTSTGELVYELGRRAGVELTTLDYGTSSTSTVHGPKVILEVSVDDEGTD